MEGLNKLSLSIEGVPLLRRSALTLLSSHLQEIVVVVGHAEAVARQSLLGLSLEVVSNPGYKQGQMHSVYCGMEALSQQCDGIMVCLSDQPLMEAKDIDRLIETFLAKSNLSVLVPTYRGARGNPIVLSYRHRQDILSEGRNLGCKHFIEKNPDWVTPLEMENDHCVFDLDTPDDLAELHRRLESMPPTRHNIFSVQG